MENKDISQIALQRIKESGIKPISKNIFNLKRVLFWSLVGTFLFVGIISFSITLSLLVSNDWYLYGKFGPSFILKSLPYFWICCLLVFTILGEFYYRKTFVVYRHRIITIIGAYLLLSLVFGLILHLFGVGEKIESSLSRNISTYHGVTFDRNDFWSQPKEGLIAGKIIAIDGSVIKVIDLRNTIWVIKIDDAILGGRVKIKEGEFIKIIGDIENDYIFQAEQVRPWMGSRHNQPINNIMR